MKSVSLHVPHIEGLEKLKIRIEAAIHEVLPLAIDAIKASDIQIEVDFNPEQTIPETGVGGFTENPNRIVLSVDSNHENVLKNIEQEIKSTVVRELHHAMRNRFYPWPGTVLDDIIGEGLADHFDIEINNQDPKPWSVSLTKEELDSYFELMKPLFHQQNTVEGYYKLVLGIEEDNIPRWAGYALGFVLVGDYLRKTGKKPSELVSLPSTKFVK